MFNVITIGNIRQYTMYFSILNSIHALLYHYYSFHKSAYFEVMSNVDLFRNGLHGDVTDTTLQAIPIHDKPILRQTCPTLYFWPTFNMQEVHDDGN